MKVHKGSFYKGKELQNGFTHPKQLYMLFIAD